MGQHTVTHDPCDPSKIVTHLTHWPVACSASRSGLGLEARPGQIFMASAQASKVQALALASKVQALVLALMAASASNSRPDN